MDYEYTSFSIGIVIIVFISFILLAFFWICDDYNENENEIPKEDKQNEMNPFFFKGAELEEIRRNILDGYMNDFQNSWSRLKANGVPEDRIIFIIRNDWSDDPKYYEPVNATLGMWLRDSKSAKQELIESLWRVNYFYKKRGAYQCECVDITSTSTYRKLKTTIQRNPGKWNEFKKSVLGK
jgi:hypothetical protein